MLLPLRELLMLLPLLKERKTLNLQDPQLLRNKSRLWINTMPKSPTRLASLLLLSLKLVKPTKVLTTPNGATLLSSLVKKKKKRCSLVVKSLLVKARPSNNVFTRLLKSKLNNASTTNSVVDVVVVVVVAVTVEVVETATVAITPTSMFTTKLLSHHLESNKWPT